MKIAIEFYEKTVLSPLNEKNKFVEESILEKKICYNFFCSINFKATYALIKKKLNNKM